MVGDVEVDALHRLHAALVFLDDLSQSDLRHIQPFVAPAVRPAM